jgi:uncharacterized protein (TIGR02687 family)
MDKLEQALLKLFDKHRIVFWYDEKQELRQEFDEMWLTGVEKIEVNNNEFSIKFRILREEINQKYLLYHSGNQPPDLQNWLLDVQLAYGVFHADQFSMWLSEVGLGSEFWELAQKYAGFYSSKSRRSSLHAMLTPHDTPNIIRMKMLAICTGEGIPPRTEDIIECLLQELAIGKENSVESIKECELEDFLWELLKNNFGYQSDKPTLRDFAIKLFLSSYYLGLGEKASLNQEAIVFIQRWKDSSRYKSAFQTLSEQFSSDLKIETDLAKRSVESLVELDYFRLIDQRIISELVKQAANRTIAISKCSQIVHRRLTTHWFGEYKNVYEAIEYAVQFQDLLGGVDLTILSISDGIQKYANTWYHLDQLYRKYIHHARISKQVSLLEALSKLIENLYINNYLFKVNNNWQLFVDECKVWDAAPFKMQRDFFDREIRPSILEQRKVVVIISDALRFEIGAELMEIICREDRFEAEIDLLVSMLPSFTQLGMAALLPNKSIELHGDGTVFVDGESTSGIENRGSILNSAIPGSTALQADQFIKMNREECRALFRDYNVVYIYHNHIDQVGDKRESEERVFEAVEDALVELRDITKKLANSNYTSIIITSDHGFIHQNQDLDESDFSPIEISGDEVEYRNRRFILGKGLHATSNVKIFKSSDLGLTGDTEVVLPKSIQRMRLKGSGARYVHGGATLQEVVIPVIKIRKKRESDISHIEIDILRGSSSIISTGQLTISFFQDQPVTSKKQERQLRAGIYAENGELISNQRELVFNIEADNPRQREIQVVFILSHNADAYNEKEVVLKLEEAIPGTTLYKEYKSARYLLRRSFTSDFDF